MRRFTFKDWATNVATKRRRINIYITIEKVVREVFVVFVTVVFDSLDVYD